MSSEEMVNVLANILAEAQQAAIAASGNEEDGGTCNMDTPAFRIERARKATIEKAAAVAGVSVSDFQWFGRQTWFWLCVPSFGQGNRRCRTMEAAQHVLERRASEIPGMSACGYYQMD